MDNLKYYILFANYEQGLALRDILLKYNIPNRIAPAPKSIQGELSCGMSLLIEPQFIEKVKQSIEINKAVYYAIIPLKNQILSKRDKYC